MRRQLRMAVTMVAFNAGLFDCAVHPFDLSVGPGMLDLGEPVLDPVFVAPHVEPVRYPGGRGAVDVARREGELDAVVGQHGVAFVWNRCDQRDQEGRCCDPVRFGHEADDGELAGLAACSAAMARSRATRSRSYHSGSCRHPESDQRWCGNPIYGFTA